MFFVLQGFPIRHKAREEKAGERKMGERKRVELELGARSRKARQVG